MEFAERRYTARDGLSLYFRDYGLPASPRAGAPAILCLGGLTRNSKDFHKPALRLKDSYRVICPDYRGRGRSDRDPNPDNYVPETYIDDIRHLLCLLNLHRVVVIGTSMGGIMAMAMSVAMPTVVVGAILNDVGWRVPAAAVAPIVASLEKEKTFSTWDEAVDSLRRGFPDLPAETDAEWLELTEATFIEGPDGQIRRDWDNDIVKPLLRHPPGDTDLTAYYGGLAGVPTGVVRGVLSHLLPADMLAEMAAARTDLLHGTVPGVGHPPNLREPEAIEVIDGVLARV